MAWAAILEVKSSWPPLWVCRKRGPRGGVGGPGDMAPSLIRNETEMTSNPVTSWIGFFQTGDLRPLFVPQPDRNALIPDVPTALAESAQRQ